MTKPVVWCTLESIMPHRTPDGETHLVAKLVRNSTHPRLGKPDNWKSGYTQTSAIIRVDAKHKIIETMNTMYHYI